MLAHLPRTRQDPARLKAPNTHADTHASTFRGRIGHEAPQHAGVGPIRTERATTVPGPCPEGTGRHQPESPTEPEE